MKKILLSVIGRCFGCRLTPSQFKDIVTFLILVAVGIWLLSRGSQQLGYHWQWYRIPKYLFYWENGMFVPGPLMLGLGVTLKIAGISLVVATCLGLITAIFRLSGSTLARGMARLYLEIIRNTPLLVQLFFIYFVMAPVLNFSRFFSAVLALSMFEGAYASEIFRAGIMSIHSGQWEAAKSIGLTSLQTYRHVIIPQAVRWILPPLTSQGISLIKDSALVSTIAIQDLTMQGQTIVSDTFMTFEIWFVVAAIYLTLTISLSAMVRALELRLDV